MLFESAEATSQQGIQGAAPRSMAFRVAFQYLSRANQCIAATCQQALATRKQGSPRNFALCTLLQGQGGNQGFRGWRLPHAGQKCRDACIESTHSNAALARDCVFDVVVENALEVCGDTCRIAPDRRCFNAGAR